MQQGFSNKLAVYVIMGTCTSKNATCTCTYMYAIYGICANMQIFGTLMISSIFERNVTSIFICGNTMGVAILYPCYTELFCTMRCSCTYKCSMKNGSLQITKSLCLSWEILSLLLLGTHIHTFNIMIYFIDWRRHVSIFNRRKSRCVCVWGGGGIKRTGKIRGSFWLLKFFS